MHAVEFCGQKDKRTLYIHQDSLDCCGINIPIGIITGVCIIKDPVTAVSHQYDLEIKAGGQLYTFPDTCLTPASKALAQLDQALPGIHIRQLEPFTRVPTIDNKQLQLFENRIRIKDYDYRKWPNETSTILLRNIMEIRYLNRTRTLSDVYILTKEDDYFIRNCLRMAESSIEAGLKNIAPYLIQKHFQPLAVMKSPRETPSGKEMVSAYVDGLATANQFIPYEHIKGLTYRRLDEIYWSMTVHSLKNSIDFSPIGLKHALPLKHQLESICTDLPIEVIGDRSIEEELAKQNTKFFPTISVYVFLLLMVGMSYIMVDSGLAIQIVYWMESNQSLLPFSIPFFLSLPLLGVLLSSLPAIIARNIKEDILDTHSLLDGTSIEELVNNFEKLQGAAPKIVSTGNDMVKHYEPFTKILFLPTGALQNRTVTSALKISHELAHYTQSLKIGSFLLMTIKNLETLFKKFSDPLKLSIIFIIIFMIFFKIHWLISVWLLAIFLTFNLYEFLVISVSLIIEFDADYRARNILKQTGLLHKDNLRSVSKYLLCLSFLRILIYMNLFLPKFNHYLRPLKDDQAFLF